MKQSIFIFLFLTFFVQSQAQHKSSYTEKDYARQPVWIGMMDDTTANFFEVEHAFDTYFKHHEMPEGEDAEMGEHRERTKFVSKRKLRRITAENKLSVQVKRYEVWHQHTLPYVQTDGRILTPSERLVIWRSQQQHH